MESKAAIGKGGFHHISLKVRDFDTSYRFYTAGLGLYGYRSWKNGSERTALLNAGNGNYLELSEGGSLIADKRSPLVHFSFRTDDCEKAIDRARSSGATISVEAKDITIPSNPPLRARIAFCKGPDGEEIEFFQELHHQGAESPPPGEM